MKLMSSAKRAAFPAACLRLVDDFLADDAADAGDDLEAVGPAWPACFVEAACFLCPAGTPAALAAVATELFRVDWAEAAGTVEAAAAFRPGAAAVEAGWKLESG